MVATARAVPGNPIDALKAEIVKILDRHRGRPSLRGVGGNLLIMIPEVVTWTVVTEGPRTGLHEGATEDPIRFAIACEEPVLFALLAGEELDFEKLTEERRLAFQGDALVLDRLFALDTGHDMLSIRNAK